MAKSKSGGTRSYIRGRVGADVYSIGRDAKGAKQQVVRSLAETVANPQTIAQMRGRMIMSTVMQAVSAMRVIIDHSFDDVPVGQPSISEFISRNYALIKADVDANPASGNSFGLVAYQEKGIKRGAYIVSDGKATLKGLTRNEETGLYQITLTADTMTFGGLKAALGWSEDDYCTFVGITSYDGFKYVRLRLNPSASDDTAITSAALAQLFITEGNADLSWAVSSNTISLGVASGASNGGAIFSQKVESGYQHSTCVLGASTYAAESADVVLPSYPIGTEMFLNGGEL